MSQLTLPAADPGLPLTRRDIERPVDALIDLLDTLDSDSDLELDLTGYSTGMDSREGDECDLGPIDIHCSQVMAAARWTKPVK